MKKITFSTILLIISANLIAQITVSSIESSLPTMPAIMPYNSLMDICNKTSWVSWTDKFPMEYSKRFIGQEFYSAGKYYIFTGIETKKENFEEIEYFNFKEKNTGKIYAVRTSIGSISPIIQDFILVPYFVKQKQLCENKYFISIYVNNYTKDLKTGETLLIKSDSRWLCKEVTLLDGDSFSYIFTNNEGNTIRVKRVWETEGSVKEPSISYFQREDIYLKNKKYRQAKSQWKLQYISKFGEIRGKNLFQGEIDMNCTPEMCLAAWGEPVYTVKTTTPEGIVYEKWYYNIYGNGKALHFSNGKLAKIVEVCWELY